MLEEFHGIRNVDNTATLTYQQKYGWNSLTASVWLPSYSELVGTTGQQDPEGGCYYSAMQGMNTSDRAWTDAQGGTQWGYFKQYNASGGGEVIWSLCGREQLWTRSPVFAYADRANSFNNNGTGHSTVTASVAVHPAVLTAP